MPRRIEGIEIKQGGDNNVGNEHLAVKKMLAVQRAHRARANYSEEKKEELRRINRERARQRRAHMTEEEKQLVRVRQRLNTRKKREAQRQKQKDVREETYPQNQTNFSKSSQQGEMLTNHATSSSSTLLGPLSIPHPQGFTHALPLSRSHHSQNQPMGISGQWNANNLGPTMSQPQVPISYQRSGQIHPDPNNLVLSPQPAYQQQRYDGNEFNDRTQMQGQLKMTMSILEDCVRRLSTVEKEVLTWKTRFEAEVERRNTLEEWVLEKFGVDLRVKFSRFHGPVKPKAANNRGKKRKKTNVSEDRFSINHEPVPKIPAATASAENLWSLDAEAMHTALNLENIAYNALSVANNIPPFNVIKDEPVVDLYSSTINPNSSIISYK